MVQKLCESPGYKFTSGLLAYMEENVESLEGLYSRGIRRLYEAVECGSVDEYRQVLDNEVSTIQKQDSKCELTRQQIVERLLTTHVENNSTALIAAARGNHREIVRFLLDECLVDIEQTGRVKSFQNSTYDRYVDDATPLWISSTGGHVELVKDLIDRGADLNHGTRTKSTPFRGACFHGHMDIIRTLERAGCDVNLYNDQLQTPLLTACATGQLSVVKFLFEIGAKRTVESTGLNELFVAASYSNYDIVRYLVSSTGDEYSVEEKIMALELAGASVIDMDKGMGVGLSLWQEALELRRTDSSHLLNDLQNVHTVNAYRNVMEPVSDDDLLALATDPDMMMMRALAVRERVLGTHHPFTAHQVRYRAVQYIRHKMYDRCIDLMKHAMKLQNQVTCRVDSPAFEEDEIILVHARLFQYFSLKWYFTDMEPFFSDAVHKMEKVLKSITAREETEDMRKAVGKLMVSCLHLLAVWIKCLCESKKLQDDEHSTKVTEAHSSECVTQLVRKLILLDPRNEKGQTLLHLACTHETKGAFAVDRRPMEFPSLPVVKCLIKSGHRLNIQSNNQETPFLLACNRTSRCKVDILNELLTRGTYAHCRDIHGRTALQLCTSGSEVSDWLSEHLPFKTLQSFSACAVKDNLISYVGHVPTSLHRFLDYH